MVSKSNKIKHFLVLALKFFVVGGAFYYIYNRLTSESSLNFENLIHLIRLHFSVWNLFLILLLTFLNRFFEILKWQNLVQVIQPISIMQATNQVLGALTAGIFTPNGLGEYAGKALYFKKKFNKKIVFLNLICNGIQMLLSVLFGVIGMLLFSINYHWIEIEYIAYGLLFIIGIILFFWTIKKFEWKGYSLEQLLLKMNTIPKDIHQKNIFLGFARYLVFSHQYYLFFKIFDITTPYWILMACISSVYLIASVIPSFQFLDFAVKGSIAIYFFNFLGINNWVVVFVTTAMWFLNVVLPVIWGSYFVLKFKIEHQLGVPEKALQSQ